MSSTRTADGMRFNRIRVAGASLGLKGCTAKQVLQNQSRQRADGGAGRVHAQRSARGASVRGAGAAGLCSRVLSAKGLEGLGAESPCAVSWEKAHMAGGFTSRRM